MMSSMIHPIGKGAGARRGTIMRAAARCAAVIIPLILLTQCFQVTHVLEWKDDGTLDVRWLFRFSKSLEQAQQGQQGGEKKGESMSDMMEKQKKELPDNLRGLVKNLAFKKVENEFDSGMEVSFQVADYDKFPYEKMKKEDFPLVPRYIPAKKQLVFHFEPVKKEGQEQGGEKKKEEKPDEGGETGGSAAGGERESMDQMNAMGKQISQMFLASVRYQIFLGKRFNADRVTIKKGAVEKKGDVMKIGDMTVIDLPLFAMFGEKEEPFDLIIYLK